MSPSMSAADLRKLGIKAKGVARGREMNKLEAAWASYLTELVQNNTILWFAYESITLRLGHDCRYTPDFVVMNNDGTICFYEVKGFWRDDARVKIKAAASLYPMFGFIAMTKDGLVWKQERINL